MDGQLAFLCNRDPFPIFVEMHRPAAMPISQTQEPITDKPQCPPPPENRLPARVVGFFGSCFAEKKKTRRNSIHGRKKVS